MGTLHKARWLLLGGLALCGSLIAASVSAQAQTTIDTTGSWDGERAVCGFGRPDTATYGQVITSPIDDTVLKEFAFYLRSDVSSSTLVLRGEVYAWDETGGAAAGSGLWEGLPRTLTVSSTPREVIFDTGGLALTAGQQYVLFASVSKDYEQNAATTFACWGFLFTDTYDGGGFFYLNDTGDESQWTSRRWADFFGFDLAFKASFLAPVPTSKDQCKNGGWKTFGVFKNEGACVSFVATGGKNPPGGH
jgi:hypothetical protein